MALVTDWHDYARDVHVHTMRAVAQVHPSVWHTRVSTHGSLARKHARVRWTASARTRKH